MRTNTPLPHLRTHEGAVADRINPRLELQRTVTTCMLFENTFYEKGADIAARIADLIKRCDPNDVARLAVLARNEMYLRHVPLFMARELARQKGTGTLVAAVLQNVIQRADQLNEFLSLYWKDGKCPLAAGVKRGLASAAQKFNAYQFAKYDHSGIPIKLRDVVFLTHPKPGDDVIPRLVNKTHFPDHTKFSKFNPAAAYGDFSHLPSPDTIEKALTANSGEQRKAEIERLLRERKLGASAFLNNLSNMLKCGVDLELIKQRAEQGLPRILPFQFIRAAKHAPQLEPVLEQAMLQSIQDVPPLTPTVLLVDVSGSMDDRIHPKTEVTRIDVACGLAILLREICTDCAIFTFSAGCISVPPRRGFALRDSIAQSQVHGGTYLRKALEAIKFTCPAHANFERIITITDEQSHDGILEAFLPKSYCVNVAPYKNGVSYGGGWTHIDGWSERIVDYIRVIEDGSLAGVENPAEENAGE